MAEGTIEWKCSLCGKSEGETARLLAREAAVICSECLRIFRKQEIERLREREKEWEKDVLQPALSRKSERSARFATSSIPSVRSLYTPASLENWDYLDSLGFPGSFPFTRGVQPSMYRGRLWTMRQYAGLGSAEETNKRFKFLLRQGQTGLSVAFDLPTQLGYDSNHPRASGEVGKVGVAIDTLADMETLFDGIPLGKVSTSMTINASAVVLLAMYVALAQKQGFDPARLEGTVQNDILKEYMARGTYIFPPRPGMRLVIDTIEYCTKNMPRWNPISVSGYHIREAGATALQELSFTLLDGLAYVEAAIKQGLAIDEFSPRISFFFSAHNNLFEEVAKFRAARRIWATAMRERGARDPRSMMLRFHAQTAGSTLAAQQPLNNIVRTTIQALAAVLGGAQSLHTNSFDEALCLPTEESVRTALRTQQIIAFESGVADTIDPAGGSYYLEYLTARLESDARTYMDEIEKRGGILRAVEDGYVQREIQNSAYLRQLRLEKKEEIQVGVNEFQIEETRTFPRTQVGGDIEEKQKAALKEVINKRDAQKVREALTRVKDAAQGSSNLIPPIIRAVKEYASLGEICQVLREVFGEYCESKEW